MGKLKNSEFYVQNPSPGPKIDPHVNFSNFQAEEIFLFSKLSMRKEQQQPRD